MSIDEEKKKEADAMTRETLTTSNRRWGKIFSGEVVPRIGGGEHHEREGVPKWSPELGVERIIRERGYPSGPQNWGWRASSERGGTQVVPRIGGGEHHEREGVPKWSPELGVESIMREKGSPRDCCWAIVVGSCRLFVVVVGVVVGVVIIGAGQLLSVVVGSWLLLIIVVSVVVGSWLLLILVVEVVVVVVVVVD